MNGSDRLKPRRGTVPTAAALVAAALALLAAAPADAGWLGRGIAVGGAGYAVSKTMEENIGILGKMWEAIDKNDDESFARLQAESEKTQGKLIMRAFPILGVPHAIAQKLKSAKEKIDRFVGGARQKVTDARAALSVDRDSPPEAEVLAGKLPSPPAGAKFLSPGTAPSGSASSGWSAGSGGGRPATPPSGEAARVIAHARGCWNHEVDVSDPDDYAQFRTMMERRVRAGASLDCAETRAKAGEAGGKQAAATADVAAGSEETDPVTAWILSEQKSRPHCYGIVDEESLPADCFEPASAATPGTKKVQGSPRAEGEGFDWASGEWTVEGSGWAGWDRSDDRYTDEDREAARVGYFAARCWGVHGVSTYGGGLYTLMQERMKRNDCPNEAAAQAPSGDSGSEYATALAGVLGEDSAAPAGDDYLAALSDLEAKEAERRRREAEERERLARLEEERERQARLEKEERRERARQAERRRREEQRQVAEQRRLDALERQQQIEYQHQVIRNVGESLRGLVEQMNRTYGGGGLSDGGGGLSECYDQCMASNIRVGGTNADGKSILCSRRCRGE